jgi:hypothetical protein
MGGLNGDPLAAGWGLLVVGTFVVWSVWRGLDLLADWLVTAIWHRRGAHRDQPADEGLELLRGIRDGTADIYTQIELRDRQ